MYPILLNSFLNEQSKSKELFENEALLLKYVFDNFSDFIVLNGDLSGQTISNAIRTFGKSSLGENGISTEIFKNSLDRLFELNINEEDQDTMIYPFGVVKNILSTDYLIADSIELNGKAGIYEEKSFMILIALSGGGTISDYDSSFKIKKGSIVFIPAKMRIELMGSGRIIIAHV